MTRDGAHMREDAGRNGGNVKWGSMGIRQWFVDLLSRGHVPEPDPDEVVELETAPLSQAPIFIEALQREGIDASSVEAFDPVTAITRAKVMVRRADLPAASEVAKRLR